MQDNFKMFFVIESVFTDVVSTVGRVGHYHNYITLIHNVTILCSALNGTSDL